MGQIERGERKPGRDDAKHLADALEVMREVVLRATGDLGVGEHVPEPKTDPVLSSIRVSKLLTREEKNLLAVLYRRLAGLERPR
jgi:hypothetical protein